MKQERFESEATKQRKKDHWKKKCLKKGLNIATNAISKLEDIG